MNIGEVAKASGLPAKTIRYYEQIKLLSPAKRSSNGYRDYSEHELEQLRFLQRARSTGFDIEECRQLLSLQANTSRHSLEVKQLVQEKADQVAQKIAELTAMHKQLSEMAAMCQADNGPECAILNKLNSSDD